MDFTKIHGPPTMRMGFLVSCSRRMVAGCCQEHFVETREEWDSFAALFLDGSDGPAMTGISLPMHMFFEARIWH